MTEAPESAAINLDDDEFRMGSLFRMASWGIGAAVALFLAVLAGLSDPGSMRIVRAVAKLSGTTQTVANAPTPVPAAAPILVTEAQPQLSLETRRLSEQVRLLAADRDRLLQRLSVVEHNLGDITGSIKRQEAKPAPQPQPPPAPVIVAAPSWAASPQMMMPWTTPAAIVASKPDSAIPRAEFAAITSSAAPQPPSRPAVSESNEVQVRRAERSPPKPQAQAAQQHASLAAKAEPTSARAAYGIDLGGAVSVDRLGTLWNAVRASQTQTGILNGLRPLASVREAKPGGRPEIRLVVGPLPSSEAAKRLCSALSDSGRFCEPTIYHGQHITGR